MKLFEPLNVGGMIIPNRVMVPAMVTRLSGEDGLVNKDISDRYVRYAQGGAGSIVIEAMAVHQSKSGPLLRISDDQYVPGLSDLVRRIHDTSDSKVVPQIIHFLKVAKSGWRQTVDMLSLQRDRPHCRGVRRCGGAGARCRLRWRRAAFGARLHARVVSFAHQSAHGRLRREDAGRPPAFDRPDFRQIFAARSAKTFRSASAFSPTNSSRTAIRSATQSSSACGWLSSARHICPCRSAASSRTPFIFPARCPIPTPAIRAIAACLETGIRRCRTRIFRRRSKPLSGRMVSTRRSPPPGKYLIPTTPSGWSRPARSTSSASRAACWPIPTGRTRFAAASSIASSKCDYCNVCKHLDGTHTRVICALWPQGSLQAPPDDRVD